MGDYVKTEDWAKDPEIGRRCLKWKIGRWKIGRQNKILKNLKQNEIELNIDYKKLHNIFFLQGMVTREVKPAKNFPTYWYVMKLIDYIMICATSRKLCF